MSNLTIMTFNISDNTTVLSNATIDEENPPTWSGNNGLFYLVICILATLSNGSTLLILLCDRRLRTKPFNVYVINLLSANLFSSLVQYPMAVVTERLGGHWHMGRSACFLYLHCLVAVSQGMLNTHALIATNRVWAIVHPVSYRSHHSLRFALFACGTIWLWIHFFGILFLAVVPIGLDLDKDGCQFDAIADLGIFSWLPLANDFITLVIPFCIVMLSFPVIVVRMVRQLRVRQRPGPPTAMVLLLSQQNGQEVNPNTTAAATESQASQRRMFGRYFVLTLLTMSVAIFYTPMISFDLFVDFVSNFSPDHPSYYEWSIILYACQSFFDPILFILSLEQLRGKVMQLLKCRCCHSACVGT
ncbi:hypothetical protein BV898_12855 [Hypsibius exemplaris]|uniref:G-protein coupled receptors family 1 profile domain-containing protein n=1 Tax=Hypsibius exemplaris TaxID=2072580 RepID=A0A1W0WCJ0_HYPEX|nr:hypothetical protein BV898_12855 [Hypsibius exemplaris]